MKAARIISQHSTNATTIGSGSFWSKLQVKWCQKLVKFSQNHSWLYFNPSLINIDFSDFIQVFRNVNHNSRTNNLTRQRSSPGTWNYRSACLPGKPDDFPDVFLVFRTSNSLRNFAVHRGIGCINHFLHLISKHITVERLFERKKGIG